jgi:hypothetical protein
VKILSVLLFFLLSVYNGISLAQVPKAEFTFSSNLSKVPEGELLEGMIKIWPLENANLQEFKNLQGQSFMNSLELLDLQSVALSENNADVVEIKGLFVASKKGSPSLTQIPYQGQFITISPLPFEVEKLKDNQNDYFIMSQSLTRDVLIKLIAVVVAAFAIIALVWKRKSILNFFKRRRDSKELNWHQIYKDRFMNAKNRQEIEALYASKKEWAGLTEKPLSGIEEFSRVMELHQYKKEWGEKELSEVMESLEVLRRSFL